ncbi:MAG: nucleoside hydrolase [Mariniphaga sp.]
MKIKPGLILKATGTMVFIIFFLMGAIARNPKVIIDSDTGNEIDDVPAIALALMSNEIEVAGITAAHWNRFELCGRNTMLESWELNNRILQYLGISDIPSLKGAEEMVGRQWAIEPPRQSAASDFIIKEALDATPDDKLIIIVTGAATNIASAVMIEPAIAKNIAVYFIGTDYIFDRKAFSKNEFNVRNDLNAFDVLLDTKDLELHIMPISVSRKLVFSKEEVYALKGKSKLGDLIIERWETIAREFDSWIMWDVALVQAFLFPAWAKQVVHDTPPENVQRKIFLYTDINAELMKADFWKLMKRLEQ